MTRNITAFEISEFLPLKDSVVVHKMHFGERISKHGLVILNDDMKSSGIRPRWAKIYAVGPDQKELQPGQWIYIAHGRWTRGVKILDTNGEEHVLRKVDNNDILLVSDEEPEDTTLGTKGI